MTKKKQLIAELDAQGRLIGTRKGAPKAGEIVLPDDFDLPTDGSYVHRGGAFWPLGHGHPRVSTRPPISEHLALFHLIRAMGAEAPVESRRWAEWYNRELRQRDEERMAAPKASR